jgi:hypothetical protein
MTSEALNTRLTRREWISGIVSVSGTLLCGFDLLGCNSSGSRQSQNPFASGRFLGTVALVDEEDVPLDRLTSLDLDGRLHADLSKFTADDVVTSTEKFYIRSRAS